MLAESKSAEFGINKKLIASSSKIKSLLDRHNQDIEAIEKRLREWNHIRIGKLIAMGDEFRKQGGDPQNQLCLALRVDPDKGYTSEEWINIFKDNLGSLTQYFKTHPELARNFRRKYREWEDSQAQIKTLRQELKIQRTRLGRDENLREAYLEAILKDDYWFTTDEIEILAFLHKLHVEVYAVFNNEVYKASNFNPEAEERRVIFQTHSPSGKGYHFSRTK